VTSVLSAAQSLKQATSLDLTQTMAPYVYHALYDAWQTHEAYIHTYGEGPKDVLWVGMNPGPWGMAQTGIPFGEVKSVQQFLKLSGELTPHSQTHPNKPLLGFNTKRSEVSGQRLWGAIEKTFETPDVFFKRHYVLNYCPLMFLDEGGRNLTPDKLKKADWTLVEAACAKHLYDVCVALEVKHVIGIGVWSTTQAKKHLGTLSLDIRSILHPSPASPAANQNWWEKVYPSIQDIL
jgi:single-strand selective monofunctional uracil DNA glycosylase